MIGGFGLKPSDGKQHERLVNSPWDIDRMILYVAERYSKTIHQNDPLFHIRQEFRAVQATTIDSVKGTPSTMPLYYAAESLADLTDEPLLRSTLSAKVKTELDEISSFFNSEIHCLLRKGDAHLK